jgi:hypothetical protein
MQITRHARRAANGARITAPSEGLGIAAPPGRTASKPAATGSGTPHSAMPSGAVLRAEASGATAAGNVERGDRP